MAIDETMKTTEDFKLVTNDIVDYYGFLESSKLSPASYRGTMEAWCYSEEVDGKTFIRMGVKDTTGTLLTKDEFQSYFDEFGQVMLTFKEWVAYKEQFAEEAI